MNSWNFAIIKTTILARAAKKTLKTMRVYQWGENERKFIVDKKINIFNGRQKQQWEKYLCRYFNYNSITIVTWKYLRLLACVIHLSPVMIVLG